VRRIIFTTSCTRTLSGISPMMYSRQIVGLCSNHCSAEGGDIDEFIVR